MQSTTVKSRVGQEKGVFSPRNHFISFLLHFISFKCNFKEKKKTKKKSETAHLENKSV